MKIILNLKYDSFMIVALIFVSNPPLKLYRRSGKKVLGIKVPLRRGGPLKKSFIRSNR